MILPQIKSVSLISISQLCDNYCNVLLNKKKLYAFKQSELILEGNRNNSGGLWDIPVQKRSITQNKYALPLTYPGVYKDITHKAQHTSFFQNATNPKNTLHSPQK